MRNKDPMLMSHDEFEVRCWNYYITLEDKFIHSTHYVTLSEDNFETYSLDFMEQLHNICIEIESVFKIITGFYNQNDANIANYAKKTLELMTDIVNYEVNVINEHNIKFKPFYSIPFDTDKPLFKWWRAFTDIKHNRIEKQDCANLYNVLSALAALFILDMTYLKKSSESEKRDSPQKSSCLFTTKDIKWQAVGIDTTYFKIQRVIN